MLRLCENKMSARDVEETNLNVVENDDLADTETGAGATCWVSVNPKVLLF